MTGQLSDLADLGEALAAQMAEAAVRPDPDRLERLAINLNGAAQVAMRMRQALVTHEAGADGQ